MRSHYQEQTRQRDTLARSTPRQQASKRNSHKDDKTEFKCLNERCEGTRQPDYGVMSRTYGSDRTGTTLFIGYKDASSYLVR